jgi:hypothetical protein
MKPSGGFAKNALRKAIPRSTPQRRWPLHRRSLISTRASPALKTDPNHAAGRAGDLLELLIDGQGHQF